MKISDIEVEAVENIRGNNLNGEDNRKE